MMRGKKGNNLILIENGLLTSYMLDDKNVWEVGRPSKGNIPDIKLKSATVSRKHGKFQNMDGVWFYLDYNSKNGTIYNHKHINAGINGRVKPVMLETGDTFLFGGGEEEVINSKTIWGLYTTRVFEDLWRIMDSKGYKQLQFISDGRITTMMSPEKGLVIENENGIAIYMGDIIYMIGDMEVIGC